MTLSGYEAGSSYGFRLQKSLTRNRSYLQPPNDHEIPSKQAPEAVIVNSDSTARIL